MIKTITATEYIAPLREGGSLPGIIRADDGQLYAMKFIGAGQGPKALIAELISGEIARVLGFNMPEIVFIELNAEIARSEPDAEIQDLLQASIGLNLGLRFLEHSLPFNLLSSPNIEPNFASHLVWFDAYTTNVDRTSRNVNLLIHQEEIWLIDHGASLYFHHNWQDPLKQSETPFPLIKDHVLLPLADKLIETDMALKKQLNKAILTEIVKQIPEKWLIAHDASETAETYQQGYVAYLEHRLAVSDIFVKEAQRVRSQLL